MKQPFDIYFETKNGRRILSNFNFNIMNPKEKNTTPILDVFLDASKKQEEEESSSSETQESDKSAIYSRFASKFSFDFSNDAYVYGLGFRFFFFIMLSNTDYNIIQNIQVKS